MKKKEEGNKKTRNYLIAAALIAAAAVITFIVIYINAPLEVKTIDVRFNVSNSLGADLNGSAITFGNVFPGSIATRNIDLINNRNFPVEASFFASEGIINFISVENTTILPGEKLLVPVKLIVPDELAYGNYSGRLKIVITRLKEDK